MNRLVAIPETGKIKLNQKLLSRYNLKLTERVYFELEEGKKTSFRVVQNKPEIVTEEEALHSAMISADGYLGIPSRFRNAKYYDIDYTDSGIRISFAFVD